MNADGDGGTRRLSRWWSGPKWWGSGTPVVDLLRRAGLTWPVAPVLITGGDLQRREQGNFMVPKRDLMAGLVVRLERGQLKIAAGLKDGEQLVREMAGMRVRVTASGREEYGAWRAGEQDDLVVAAALACWGGTKYYPGDGGVSAGYAQRDGEQSWERDVRAGIKQRHFGRFWRCQDRRFRCDDTLPPWRAQRPASPPRGSSGSEPGLQVSTLQHHPRQRRD